MDGHCNDGWTLQRDPEVAVVAEGDSNKRRFVVMAGGGGGGGNGFGGEKMRKCLGKRKRECRCIDIFRV